MFRNKIFFSLLLLIFILESQLAFSDDWERIFLATSHRSGNHWIRYLVEEASGIASGAVYQDKEPMHMDKVFPWGGYCPDHGYEGNRRYPTKEDIVFIKTHFPDSEKTIFDENPYRLAIRIVRNPVDCFYSRYVKNPKGPLLSQVPSEKINGYIQRWKRFQLYWNKQKHVITFRYEDILTNPFPFLKKICKALKYNLTDEDLERAIAKYPPEGHMFKHIDKFKTKDLRKISEELEDLLVQFDYQIPF